MNHNKQEIILNLWYIYDDEGFIYSLRARSYLRSGTDEEKLAYLKDHALTDYLIAQSFKLPSWCKTNIVGGSKEESIPIVHIDALRITTPNILNLFEDAIKELESNLPFQSKLEISQEPLVIITPLIGDEDGNIYPQFSKNSPL